MNAKQRREQFSSLYNANQARFVIYQSPTTMVVQVVLPSITSTLSPDRRPPVYTRSKRHEQCLSDNRETNLTNETFYTHYLR